MGAILRTHEGYKTRAWVFHKAKGGLVIVAWDLFKSRLTFVEGAIQNGLMLTKMNEDLTSLRIGAGV